MMVDLGVVPEARDLIGKAMIELYSDTRGRACMLPECPMCDSMYQPAGCA